LWAICVKYVGYSCLNIMNEKFLKPYDPKETEERIYKLWEESGFFNPDNLPGDRKETYTIVIPPPNITGNLHMGHALNNTTQDILIRWKRMQGYKTLWLPGTDHAGIATQNVVEKQLKKEGLSRHDLGREKFIAKVWEWKEKYGDIILKQLRKLGCSCDWSRTRFTMDEGYAKAVETAFKHYYDKGWIYQGDRVVNWCPRCQTSLSDLELEYEEASGKLWFIKYPLKNGNGYITVATTRPETMLGDAAVAVNPKDERYNKLVGQTVILPIINREIPIIADRLIEMEFGTGVVKVTPGHDLADFEISERHKLPVYKIIDKYGKMTAEAGKDYENLKALEVRERVIAKLEELGLMEKTEDYQVNLAKCYRCDSVIEPQVSKQWFLKMDKLAKLAKNAVKKGKIKFHPKKWGKVYLTWLENIRDWCISRQLWWGHKIPLEGVSDVLDTWFSSALWPFAVLGWPEKTKDLKEFYPTQTLSTARDIINLWVTRMIFSAAEFIKERPFSEVLIHPTVLNKEGKRMSKSLGTGTDPLDLIEKYGADATRFGIIYQMMGNQDLKFSEEPLMAGKKFMNKLWNMARFIMTKTEDKIFELGIERLKIKDLKSNELMGKLDNIIKVVNKNLDNYEFGQALHLIYDFAWHDFADKYIEYSKDKADGEINETISYVYLTILKLLHPFTPFITEEIWGLINKERRLLIIEKWPK